MKGKKIDLRNVAWYLFLGLLIVEFLILPNVNSNYKISGWLWLVPISLYLIQVGLNLFKKKL